MIKNTHDCHLKSTCNNKISSMRFRSHLDRTKLAIKVALFFEGLRLGLFSKVSIPVMVKAEYVFTFLL